MNYPAGLHVLAAGSLLVSCASARASGGQLSGTSGPVHWEVTNISQQRSASGTIRWEHTVVLRETSGANVVFSRVERRAQGKLAPPSVRSEPFERRLAAYSEIKVHHADRLGPAGSPNAPSDQEDGLREGMVVVRRYVGEDDRGHEVVVTVRLQLDPGVGKLIKPGEVAPLPPLKMHMVVYALRLEAES